MADSQHEWTVKATCLATGAKASCSCETFDDAVVEAVSVCRKSKNAATFIDHVSGVCVAIFYDTDLIQINNPSATPGVH